ncbi:MAG TPA: hypothetical protein VHE36_04800 [Sphingomicrobium sp.]|nr:hypothetical protein [Sphingomicrobium sp.]
MPVGQPARIPEPNVIKRAFDIASECGSLSELKRRLVLEGYFQVNAHLSGWQIRRDLAQKLNRKLARRVPKRVWEVVER